MSDNPDPLSDQECQGGACVHRPGATRKENCESGVTGEASDCAVDDIRARNTSEGRRHRQVRASTPRESKALLDLAQASAYLGTTERHVKRLWQERRIAAVKVGRRVRFTEVDLDAYIEKHRHEALR